MTLKWNKKLAIEHITKLTSPFEELVNNKNKRIDRFLMPNVGQIVRDVIERNRGMEAR